MLVKGLDFALLAKRKAELEREKGAKVEDELDALGSAVLLKPKSKAEEKKPERKESNKVSHGTPSVQLTRSSSPLATRA